MLLEIRNALFGYEDRPVVRVDALRLHETRCLGIFGPNGAGKSTLVRGMVGLLKPLAGNVSRKDGLSFGYLPQHRALDLHWPMTGLDAASMAISGRSRFGWIGRKRQRVLEAMDEMQVVDLGHDPFAKLSDGQQQRVLLAGAMSTDPDVLVLDEPTDGLDVRSRKSLLKLLRGQNTKGLCTVIISHDVQDLLFLADEIAWLECGDDSMVANPVEVISPDQLADRVIHAKRAAS